MIAGVEDADRMGGLDLDAGRAGDHAEIDDAAGEGRPGDVDRSPTGSACEIFARAVDPTVNPTGVVPANGRRRSSRIVPGLKCPPLLETPAWWDRDATPNPSLITPLLLTPPGKVEAPRTKKPSLLPKDRTAVATIPPPL